VTAMSEIGTALLIVGGFYSRCSACRRNADPHETHHTMARMEGEGCGALFEAMTSWEGDRTGCERLRPDLPYQGIA
jgi:hypothetical protein